MAIDIANRADTHRRHHPAARRQSAARRGKPSLSRPAALATVPSFRIARPKYRARPPQRPASARLPAPPTTKPADDHPATCPGGERWLCGVTACAAVAGQPPERWADLLGDAHGYWPIETTNLDVIIDVLARQGRRCRRTMYRPSRDWPQWANAAEPGVYLVFVSGHVLAAEVHSSRPAIRVLDNGYLATPEPAVPHRRRPRGRRLGTSCASSPRAPIKARIP